MARGRGRSLLALPMRGGVDELNDERHVQPGKALVLENARWETMGRYEKRAGHTVKATTINGSALDTATTKRGRLASFESELICVDGLRLGSYVPTLTTDLRDRGFVSDAQMFARGVVSDAFSVGHVTVAESGTVRVWVWTPVAGPNALYVYAAVFDVTTGACITPPFKLSSAACGGFVRAASNATKIFVTYFVSGSTVKGRVLDLASLVWAAETTVTTAAIDGDHDIAANDERVWIASIENASGNKNPRLQHLDLTLAVQYTYDFPDARTTAKYAVGCAQYFEEHVLITYATVSAGTSYACAVGYLELAGGLATLSISSTATAPVDFASGATDSYSITTCERIKVDDFACVVAGISGSTPPARLTKAARVSALAGGSLLVDGNNRLTYALRASSKPFVRDGRVYGFAYVGGLSTSSVGSGVRSYSACLVDYRLDDMTAYSNGAPARPVALDMPRQCDEGAYQTISSVVLSGDKAIAGIIAIASGSIYSYDTADRRTSGAVLEADFAADTLWQTAELGQAVQFSGGFVSHYDGISTGELGFFHEPLGIHLANSATSGSLVNTKTYRYCVIFVAIDARGQTHRSPPSEIVQMQPSGTSLDISFSSYGLSLRQQMGDDFARIVSAEVYRTKATDDDPNTFYRTTAIAVDTSSFPYNERITINDGTADNVLDGTSGGAGVVPTPRPTLYTSGAAGEVIVNELSRSMHGLVAARGRLWGIYGNRVHFTKPIVDGVAPEFFPDSRAVVIEDAKALTAIAPLDDKIVVFSETGIWVSMAEGPDALYRGVLPSFRQVSSDYGCIDARSIGATPTGITFQSRAGLYMLTRALEVAFIGGDIQATLDTYPTVTSTVVHPSGQYMLFGVTDGTSGRRIIRDTRAQLFGVDALASSGGAVFPVSQVVVGPDYFYLGSDGRLYQEDTSTHLDDSAWVTLKVKLPHIQAAGLGGSQDTQRLVVRTEKFTDYDLNLRIYSDFETSASQTKLFGHATIAAYTVADQHEIDIVRQDCQSMAVELYDATPTGGGTIGTGRGAAFIGVTLELQPVDGPVRLPGANRG